jgi:cell wall-associated NlpC family hydrolase
MRRSAYGGSYGPHADLRSRGSAIYNCVGLVFASRRTSIEPSEIDQKILADDGYRRLGAAESPALGDVVIYRSGDGSISHVGIVASSGSVGAAPVIRVLSKWGPEGEYLHPLTHVPEVFGTPSEYWTDRHAAE